MNIKKAISYIAFGFLFTLVNINLTLNGKTLNVTPDFIGWILFYLAIGCLGKYVSDKPYLKVVSLVLAVVKAVVWVLDFVKPDVDIWVIKTVVGVVEAVFMFIFFGVIERIAADHGSSRADTIRILKWINIVSYVALEVMAIMKDVLSIEAMATILLVFGLALLVSAIITMFVLFGLRSEINEKLA